LPTWHSKIVGHDEAIEETSDLLRSNRVVSLVASGGIGKTAVAIAVAHLVRREFGGAVYFLDLTAYTDPLLACRALASALGIAAGTDIWLLDLMRMLRDRRALLVLDGCEHMVESVAALAELLLRAAPQVHMLATSRTPLRAEGERIVVLQPLKCPPGGRRLTAAEAMSHSAVRLFMDRVAASGHPFKLSDEDAPAVGKICRRLDGIALAIELAARRAGTYGIPGTAALLDSPSRLFWPGERGRTSRHATLNATLDWSYRLLSPFERQTLRQISVFSGMFASEAVLAVSDPDVEHTQLFSTMAALVEKSLVVAVGAAETKRYRLLETTRAYLMLKLVESGERHPIARRHALYCAHLLEKANSDSRIVSDELPALYAQHGRDVRAALQWSFSEEGDLGLSTTLASGSALLFSRVSSEARSDSRRSNV
jgi:predicted ATPase